MKKNLRHQVDDSSSDSYFDSWLFKFGSKLAVSLVVILLFLTLTQCTVKKPESPIWETQLTVPLVHRTYLMPEIVEKMDQDAIQMDLDSNVVLTLKEQMDTVTLDNDELSTGDIAYSVQERLGTINLTPPTIDPMIVRLDMISGLAAFVPGMIPATRFNINNAPPVMTSYTSLGIISGGIWIVAANNLGFEIDADSVELYDLTYNRTIAIRAFANPIVAGVTDSVYFPLDGQTISNRLESRISASTPGGTILSTAGKDITTIVRFVNTLTVGAATAEIPAISRPFSQALPLGEADLVYRATISSGTLQVDIGNQTNLTTRIDITFPDLVSNGQPLAIQQVVSGISSGSATIDLSGYELLPLDSSAPQQIEVRAVATIAATAPQHVAINQSDQFSVDASITGLTFDTVTGIFASVGSTIAPTTQEIDVPDGFDSLQLVSAILTLSIENGVNLPGTIDLTLNGNNGKTLQLSGAIQAGTIAAAITTEITDNTVADFLSPLPSSIDISGNVAFGDGVSVGTINTDDYIYAEVSILAPLEIIIPETRIETDIEREEIDAEDAGTIVDHVTEARLIYNVTNHLPLGVSVNLFLSGDSATILTNPQTSFIDDIFIIAAPTTASLVTEVATTGEQQIILKNVDLQVLKNNPLFIGTELIIRGSEGQPVKLTNNDYITVAARIEIDYRFDGDF